MSRTIVKDDPTPCKFCADMTWLGKDCAWCYEMALTNRTKTMSESEWTCAGCGILSPNKQRSCDCPTNVVCRGPAGERKQAWKALDAKEPVAVTGVHLKRIGNHAVVAVEMDGKWIDIIEEYYDGNFSHICEPGGMRGRATLLRS